MSTEIWYLLFNSAKELLCTLYKVEVRDIADLKRAIEERCSHLENVKAFDPVVWRCKEPTFLSTEDPDKLHEYLLEIDFNNREQVVKLNSGAEIADLELGKKEVLLVQVLGVFSCSQVCPLSFSLISSLIDTSPRTEEEQFRYLTEAQRTRLALVGPSKINAFSAYQRLQNDPEQKILDDFPQPDLNIPPLALLYNGFGRFYDHITSAASSQTFCPDLKMLVDQLVAKASEILSEEYLQQTLPGILREILFPSQEIKFSTILESSRAKTDGHVIGPHDGPIFIVELKRQITPAEPQMAAYFHHLARQTPKATALAWRQPCLGVIIRGLITYFLSMSVY